MAELRISELPAGSAAQRQVQLMWQDGAARRVAVSSLGDLPDERDGERIRWYLEDYAEFPADPAPAIALEAEAQLAQAGADLFRRVFSDPDAVGIWERARDRLGQVRVEVDADPGVGRGLAWELLRDPARDQAVALGAGAFVRTHLQAAGHPDLPEPAGDRLRVLLVISRPGGREDVPFRSVASRLVRGGAEQMEGLDLDVLRPPTFSSLSQVVSAAHEAGRPYHVVHFDGHGTYLDLADFGLKPDGTGGGGGAGARVGVSRHKYGVSVAGPGLHGYLLFEDPDSEENQQLADGPTMGRLLRRLVYRCWCSTPAGRPTPRPATSLAGSRGMRRGRHLPGRRPARLLGGRVCWRGMCMRGFGRMGRWPLRSPTRGCRVWWPCVTTSTW